MCKIGIAHIRCLVTVTDADLDDTLESAIAPSSVRHFLDTSRIGYSDVVSDLSEDSEPHCVRAQMYLDGLWIDVVSS